MADPSADQELLNEVVEGAAAMAILARDEEIFRAAVDAFRSQDGESMHDLLVRHELADRCEVICHWLRSKEAVLLCLELSGPPPVETNDGEPDVHRFAQVVAEVTADEELVELIADAVQERDVDAWTQLISRHGLESFSHLLCHWVCTVRYRLVCDVVCQPIDVQRQPLIPVLQAAGQAIGTLAANEKLFAMAASAVRADSCENLSSALAASDSASCSLVCEWFCSWRCMLACLRLCRIFPLEPIESQISEMLEFARASGNLAANQGMLERFAEAVLRDDVEVIEALVKEVKFERFCIQFCHWVCSLRCEVFCQCVCPLTTEAFFTHIGVLAYSDSTIVASQPNGNGLTVSGQRAFFNTLRLNGDLSVVAGASLVEYRFETAPTSPHGGDPNAPDPVPPLLPNPIPPSSWVPVSGSQIVPTQIGSFVRSVPLPPFFDEIQVWVNHPGGSVPGVNGIFNITPSTGPDPGWIQVPPLTPAPSMVPPGTTGWQFGVGAGLPALLNLNTTQAMPTSVVSIDESGVVAGDSAQAPLQTDVHFGVRMRLRNVGDSTDGSEAGTCDHIAINNSRYNNISHHPYWPGGLYNADPATDQEIGVCSIGIAELLANPCSDLTTSLTVTFTAAHSNLGNVNVSLEGPGGPYAFALDLDPASAPGENEFGIATPNLVGSPPVPAWSFEQLAPCAYLLKLDVDVLLTTGDADITPEPLGDYIAFCKSA